MKRVKAARRVTGRRNQSRSARRDGERPDHSRPGGWDAVIVIAITVVAMLPVVGCGFTDWDDPVNVLQNPALHPVSLAGFVHLWTHSYSSLYVPLVYTSYILDQAVGGGVAWPFHLTNLALHCASAYFAYRILRSLLSNQQSRAGALLGALVFAIHPLQVESVAWVTGRKDVLSGALALASFYLMLPCLYETRDWRRTAYASGLFVLALLAKPNVIGLPVALAGCGIFIYRQPLMVTIRRLLPFFIIAVTWGVVTAVVQTVPTHLRENYPPAWTRIFIASDTLLFYLRKVLFPARLAAVYDKQMADVISSALFFWQLPLACIVFGAALYARGRVAAAAVIFAAFLLPVLGIVPFLYQVYATVADRYMYLPMLGIGLLCAWAIESAEARSGARVEWLAGCVVAVLGVMTFRQCKVWQSSESLWQHSYEVAPEVAVTNTSMGALAAKHGNLESASGYYQRAIKLDPRSPEALNNLGGIYARWGKLAEAEKCFRGSAKLLPGNPVPLLSLSDVLQREGRVDEAMEIRRQVREQK